MNNDKFNDILDNGMNDFISVAQAAKFLGVHINTIYMYIKTGNIDAYRFNNYGKTIFIKKEDIVKKLVPINPDEYRSKSNKTVLYD